MTYQINVQQSKIEEFLLIIQSFKKLGVVKSFQSSESLAIPSDKPASNDQLMRILNRAEDEVNAGKVVPSLQVKKNDKKLEAKINWTFAALEALADIYEYKANYSKKSADS